MSIYEEWKEKNTELYEELIQGILRLKKSRFAQTGEENLEIWDDHLFLILSPSYMEKRARQQIIRGLLRDAETAIFVPPKSFYDHWKEYYQEIYEELKEGIQRLKSNKVPHLDKETITEDWWDSLLFLIISKSHYLEKRQRLQIIKGLLKEFPQN